MLQVRRAWTLPQWMPTDWKSSSSREDRQKISSHRRGGKWEPVKLGGWSLIRKEQPGNYESYPKQETPQDNNLAQGKQMSGSHSVDLKPFSVHQVGRNWDYGVYVTGLVKSSSSGMPVNFLVDTGAAVTAMSLLAYKRLPMDIQPAIEPAEFELAGVSGNTLELVGTARMTLVFQGAAFTHDIPMIDIPVEAILGQDILLEHNRRLDLSNLTLRLREVLISCWIAGGNVMTCRASGGERWDHYTSVEWENGVHQRGQWWIPCWKCICAGVWRPGPERALSCLRSHHCTWRWSSHTDDGFRGPGHHPPLKEQCRHMSVDIHWGSMRNQPSENLQPAKVQLCIGRTSTEAA